jgi:hypothetical protein
MTGTLVVSADQPDAYRSIGDALAAATEDVVVSVSPGIYYEALFVNDRAITLVAAQGPGTVTIDASAASHPTVSCNRGRLNLRDLTLKAGDGPAFAADLSTLTMTGCTLSSRFGEAVTVRNKSAFALTGCTVTGARSGLVVDDSVGTVDGCAFTDLAEDGIVVRGGGAPVTIRTTTVTRCGNRGIFIDQSSAPTIEDCDISQIAGTGIAAVDRSAPVIRRCRLRDIRGAAVSFGQDCRGTVAQCTTENTGSPAFDIPGDTSVDSGAPGRPPAIVAAVLLMIPAVLTWSAAGIGWTVVTWRLEGDFLFLFWILAVVILGLCMLLAAMTVSGMRHAWRGWSNLLRIPAGFTAALFVLALVGFVVQQKVSYQPTMVTPLVVGGLAGVSAVLLNSRPAKNWFAGGLARRAADLQRKDPGR